MFRDNLKEQIEYKGLIIKELAAKTGISKRTIDTYVSGRAVIPNAEVAVKLAKALDTSVEYLVTGTECEAAHIQTANDMAKFKKYKQLLCEMDSLPPELRNSVAALIHAAAKVSKSS